MRAGKLRHKVTIQDYTESQDSYGTVTKTWADYATVWASIEPVKGREFWESQQINAEVTAKVILRYLEGVTPKMRVKHGSRIFQVISVINPEERNRELQLMVKEVI
jgi:SPP1 family predicted phage head-tail adaptor